MELRRSQLGVILAVGLAVAACGGSNNENVTAVTGVNAGTTPATTLPTATPVTPTVTTTTVEKSTPRFVLTALDEPPDNQGWPLPAGRWQSSVFNPALAFETITDLTLISQSPEAIVLTEPNGDSDARLTILTPLAVGGDDNVPTAVPDDFETYLRSVKSIDIRAIRHFERSDGADMVMADFAAREPVGHETFSCPIGPDCLWIMKTAAGEDVHAIEGAPIRVVATTINGVPLRVVASASDRDAFDRLATQAHRIAESLATTTDEPPENSRTLLSTLGTRDRSIPPGAYIARVGDQIIEFDIKVPLDGVALDHLGSNTILFDISNAGIFVVVQPLALVDPDAKQTPNDPTADDLVDPPRAVDDYEAWLSQMFVVTDRNTTTLGGLPATSWTTMIDDSVDHYTCGPLRQASAGERCVTTFTTELGYWTTGESDVGFGYFIGDTGIITGAALTDPDRIDEFDRGSMLLLDSIRFVG